MQFTNTYNKISLVRYLARWRFVKCFKLNLINFGLKYKTNANNDFKANMLIKVY